MASLKRQADVATFIMATIVAVLLLTLLCITIPRCEASSDPDFLEVCWVDGEARYVDGAEVNDGSCARSEELAWPHEQVPLSVTTVSPDEQVLAEDDPGTRVVAQAIKTINARVRFALFSRGPANLADADAVLHWGAGYDVRGEGADAIPGFVRHRRRTPGLLRADAYLRALHHDQLARVAIHLLLHVAGLRDDDRPESVMYPLTLEFLMGASQPARITDSDVEALRARYGPR
jgi:hypothetical protein